MLRLYIDILVRDQRQVFKGLSSYYIFGHIPNVLGIGRYSALQDFGTAYRGLSRSTSGMDNTHREVSYSRCSIFDGQIALRQEQRAIDDVRV